MWGSRPGAATPMSSRRVFVPSEADISELRRRQSRAEESRQQKLDQLALKSGEAERLKAEAAAAAQATDLVTDDVAAELRVTRESAWAAHRAALTAATADAFETAMRRDDASGATRLANVRELAAARERAMKLAGVEAECARARKDFEAAQKAVQAIDCEIAALLPVRLPEGRDALSFLNAWGARRDEALAIVETLRELKEDARGVDREASKARRMLSEALAAAGIAQEEDVPLSAMIEAAEQMLADQSRLEMSIKRAKELRRRRRPRRSQAQEGARGRSAMAGRLAQGLRRHVAQRGR